MRACVVIVYAPASKCCAGGNVPFAFACSYEMFRLFDKLLLLAPGGKTVYFGSTEGALDHFARNGSSLPTSLPDRADVVILSFPLLVAGYPCPRTMNPADWYLDVISAKAGIRIVCVC